MLTDVAKQNSSQDRMESFLLFGNDAAYEIARGKKLKAGRYAFPVTLFVSGSGIRRMPDVRRDRRSWWFSPAKTSGRSTSCPNDSETDASPGF